MIHWNDIGGMDRVKQSLKEVRTCSGRCRMCVIELYRSSSGHYYILTFLPLWGYLLQAVFCYMDPLDVLKH